MPKADHKPISTLRFVPGHFHLVFVFSLLLGCAQRQRKPIENDPGQIVTLKLAYDLLWACAKCIIKLTVREPMQIVRLQRRGLQGQLLGTEFLKTVTCQQHKVKSEGGKQSWRVVAWECAHAPSVVGISNSSESSSGVQPWME